MTDATIQQLTGEVDDLTRKVNDLSNLMALFMVNGLQDAFDGSGNQTFGGGVMRLDKTGIQIKADALTRAIFFVNSLTPSPTFPYSFIRGFDDGTAPSLDITSQFNAGTYITMEVESLSGQASMVVDAFTTVGAYAGLQVYASDSSGSYVQVNNILRLDGVTSDATGLIDGMLWYRSDLFRFRIRSNGITGNLAVEIESATAPAVGNNGTITTAGVSAARVAPAGAVTGVILAVGTTGGQMCTVVNESVAASTVTFAVAGTSNVADGVASVIAGLNARTFCWNSSTALWYPVK